jgi:hypothetical protein
VETPSLRDPDGAGQSRTSLYRPGARADTTDGLLTLQLRYPPRRRARVVIAEIHHLRSRSHDWVPEGDITACLDDIGHTSLMGRMRDRVGHKRQLNLVNALLKAVILSDDGIDRTPAPAHPKRAS